MNWLESLLWDSSSVAHIVCLYAFVISVGVLLGKIKIFGVSLGVTFVLFAGILMGHFGFTGETHILHFIREFGLILFVFCIGLQVGPSFFSSFKKGGMRLNMLAVGIVLLNIAVALSIYFIDGGIDLPMIVGILYGAVTNTPGLGAAQEALNQINYTGDPIALGYACAYPLGVVGIIGSIIAIRYICRVNLKKEEQELNTQEADVKHQPHMLHLEVRNVRMTSSQLAAAKKQLIGQIGVASDNNENNALGMGKTFLHYNKCETSEAVFHRIEQLTSEALLEVANEMFAEDYLSTLIYR